MMQAEGKCWFKMLVNHIDVHWCWVIVKLVSVIIDTSNTNQFNFHLSFIRESFEQMDANITSQLALA